MQVISHLQYKKVSAGFFFMALISYRYQVVIMFIPDMITARTLIQLFSWIRPDYIPIQKLENEGYANTTNIQPV
jgi:hypothetical protein